MNAIEVRELNKSYKGKVKALNNFSLCVQESSILGLLGPNGAGKSTLINILCGKIKQSSGQVFFENKLIGRTNVDYKSKVGFVLDQPHYLDKLTVKEYLCFVGTMYGLGNIEIENKTEELIKFFDLNEKKNDWIESYSTGMKKKVSLAAALIHNPKFLILDEPLEGIDPNSAKKIKDIFRLIAKKGCSILITSHNLDSIEKLCDEVVIIDNGSIVFQSKMNRINDSGSKSLEEIFVKLTSQNSKANLSWL